MAEKVISGIIANGAFLFVFMLEYSLFGEMIANVRRRTISKMREKHARGLWAKFLYLDFYDKAVKWRYILFVVF